MSKILNDKNFNFIMTLAVFLILVVPVGMANIYLGFIKGESPCLLCGHERFGMILVGILGIFMLRYGVKIKYIATTFIVAFWFMFEGLRHIGNHAARDIGMGFGEAIFGLHTYTWAFVVYWIVVFAMGLMLFFVRPGTQLAKDITTDEIKIKDFNPFSKFVAYLSMVIVFTNVLQFLITVGIPPYGGSGSPARFTFNISKAASYWDSHHWHENFKPGKASLLGSNEGPKPWVPSINENKKIKIKQGSLKVSETLQILDKKDIKFKPLSAFGKGVAGGIAYDNENNEFAIIGTGGAAYFTNENFDSYKDFVKIDQVNGMDVPVSVDATFYGAGKLVATAWNKTIWGVEKVPADKIDKKIQWKYLREVNGDFMPMFKGSRKPIMTTRAKKAYILTLAKDPDSSYGYMISIPSRIVKNVILLKFDIKDSQINEEYVLKVSKKLGDVKASDFYFTGMDIKNGKALAISKSFNVLAIIDLAQKTIVDVYGLPDIGDAHDIAIRGDNLFVLSRKNNKDVVFILNNPL